MKTLKSQIEQARSEANEVKSLSDLQEGTLLYNRAKAYIKLHGFYAYTMNNVKIFIN